MPGYDETGSYTTCVYLNIHAPRELSEWIDRAYGLFAPCKVCPRNCGVNRLMDERGISGEIRFSQEPAKFHEKIWALLPAARLI
jgi:uncharacterized Fe-S radical SAM superfamily protein PflX